MNRQIDEKPAPLPMLLYGLQWWAVAMPSVVILGLVAGRLQFPENPAAQTAVLRRLFCLTGFTSAAQIVFGHRLPIVAGPASVLLIGMIACAGASAAAVNTAILLGGLVMALAAAGGLLGRLQALFSVRILAAIMLLIPFTLVPGILELMFRDPERHLFSLLFVPAFLVLQLAADRLLSGVWKATSILWVMIAGTAAVFAVHGFPAAGPAGPAGEAPPLLTSFEFEPGVVLSFFFCAVAVAVNEVSSVQAVGKALGADGLAPRTRRGVLVNGLASVAGGLTGVPGTVDYTTSAGIIASTGAASRYPFLPAAALLVACSLFSGLLEILLAIPGPVLAMVLLYIMSAQLAAGLGMLVRERAVATFADGLTLAIPLMLAVFASFMPPAVARAVPALVRPIFANAFVVGVVAVIVMEHCFNRRRRDA